MNPTDTRNAGTIGNGLNATARTSARTRLSAIEASDEFDTLTDLFLGEVSGRSSASAPRAEIPDSSKPAAATPAELETVQATNEEPAAPISIASAPHHATTPKPRSASATFVECVVIGHVPGLSSAWAKQYAREVSRASERPVAMLRWRSGEVAVEIIDENTSAGTDNQIASDLETALRRTGRRCTRWIVHADAAMEAELAAHPGVQLITLLTGADEAARVAGYGAVKRLGDRLPDANEPGPMIRVATIGLTPGQADAAGTRIVEAVRQFLGRDAQRAMCPGRLKALRAPQLVFMGEPGMSAAEAMALLQSSAETEEAAEREAAEITADVEEPIADIERVSATVEVSEHSQPVASEAMTSGDAPVLTDAWLREAISSPSSREPEAESSFSTLAPEPPARSEPVLEQRAAESTPTPPAAPRSFEAVSKSALLCEHLSGVHAIPARCPHASAVEIAMDEHGRAHLLVDARGGDWRINQGVADLTITEAWLDSYAAMILPGGGMTGRPVMHVFIDQPKRGRRLLDTAMQVHLLTNVDVGGEHAVVCIDLN